MMSEPLTLHVPEEYTISGSRRVVYFCADPQFENTTEACVAQIFTSSKDRAKELKEMLGWKVYAYPMGEVESFDENI
jgi:hypothetical protein